MSQDQNQPQHSYQPTRILIVDDMPRVRQELQQLLELTGGMEVIGEASNGQEAISQAEKLHPDVIIMDLEMPVLDGLQATRQIKEKKLAKRIVILSVHTEKEDVQQALKAGADEFIQKGISYSRLIEAIKPPTI